MISLFVPKSPEFKTDLGVISFDAVLEDTVKGSVEYPTFSLEFGADASDHGIIKPIEWTITGLVSNNPLELGLSVAVGAISNVFDPSTGIAIAGLSASFLAGSDDTRSSSALDLLFALMYRRIPFDVDAGDIQLDNMVIVSVERNKTPANEGGLEFVAELMEIPLAATVLSDSEPDSHILSDDDIAKYQAAGLIKKGEVLATDTSPATESLSGGVL